MSTENVAETVDLYRSSWQYQDPERISIELTSCVLETERTPDPYYYLVQSGKFRDSLSGAPVEDFCEKNGYLANCEMQALWKIQDWAIQNLEGTSMWVSAQFPGVYSKSKIILSEILTEGNIKMLLNRAIITNWDYDQVFEIFKRNPEDLRGEPIFIETKDYPQLMDFLFKNVGAQVIDQIASGFDFKRRDEVIEQVKGISYELSQGRGGANFSSLVENFDISCPLTPFKVFSGERILCCTCPICGEMVEARIYGGMIHCPRCKKEKEWRD